MGASSTNGHGATPTPILSDGRTGLLPSTKTTARLKAHGYTVATEDAADPNIDVTPEPNISSKDPQGSMPMSIAMFHVTYERRDRT